MTHASDGSGSDQDIFTCTFAMDIAKFDGNPFHVETIFGCPQTIGRGNAFATVDRLERELDDALERAERAEAAERDGRQRRAREYVAIDCEASMLQQDAHRRGHAAGVRSTITWLHKRATEMTDPHAKGVLNSAAFDLGREQAGFVATENDARPASETDQ